MAVLDSCDSTDTAQGWVLNASYFPTIPNASTGITLPPHPDSTTVWGFTFTTTPVGPPAGTRVNLPKRSLPVLPLSAVLLWGSLWGIQLRVELDSIQLY